MTPPDAENLALHFRPIATPDLALIATFPQNEDELFFFFPRAIFPLTVAQLAESVAQRVEATVAVRRGQVVGFANFYRWETGGLCAIGNVVVAPAARGHGVASSLVSHMVELAFEQYRAAEVRIACFHRNLAGLLLYPKLGFTPCAIEERRDWRGEPTALIHFQRMRPNTGPTHPQQARVPA